MAEKNIRNLCKGEFKEVDCSDAIAEKTYDLCKNVFNHSEKRARKWAEMARKAWKPK